ncbi:hypothetical protein C6N75_09900 [Streptomyces solincola]|uniref:Uncharacterized protein n=1 Tax=Streptomyces solincola TaxID=2100817 RepID=A0A2S9PY72_9ACTN|nr:hypothetical protein [Streptomyces solincola]PRH79386.1 hypothetical protein C6N75_09900 [Streptomyces solincola]
MIGMDGKPYTVVRDWDDDAASAEPVIFHVTARSVAQALELAEQAAIDAYGPEEADHLYGVVVLAGHAYEADN